MESMFLVTRDMLGNYNFIILPSLQVPLFRLRLAHWKTTALGSEGSVTGDYMKNRWSVWVPSGPQTSGAA